MDAVLYEIPGPWAGRLAIASRPRGGDWLPDDIAALQAAGVDMLVSSLTDSEAAELDLTRERELALLSGIEWVSFSIEDRGLPPSVQAVSDLVRRLGVALSSAKTIALHCRAGIGRSATLASCVLIAAGVSLDDAFARIERARGCSVPDTPEQRAWVARFAEELARSARRAAS
jgi:protein-tyrosine phosphatase